MKKLRVLVYSIIILCIIGVIFSGGKVQGLFEEMSILLVVFVLVVEFFPQFIVADEEKPTQEI
jgi:predicted Na+-dependent transporter